MNLTDALTTTLSHLLGTLFVATDMLLITLFGTLVGGSTNSGTDSSTTCQAHQLTDIMTAPTAGDASNG